MTRSRILTVSAAVLLLLWRSPASGQETETPGAPAAGGSQTSPFNGGATSFGAPPGAAATPIPLTTGTEGAATPTSSGQAAPATILVPGGNGFSEQTVKAGEGRFSRPPFRITAAISTGYDDNVFSTPTKQAPPTATATVGANGVVVVTPAASPVPRTASFTTSASAVVEMQAASGRNAFTLDLNLGATYYWSRPGRSYDYNDSLNILLVHKFTPRMQFTMQSAVAYLSQPNFNLTNAPTQQPASDYISYSSNFALSYQWTRRFSTITRYGFTGLEFTSPSGGQSYVSDDFANQLRFLISPRLTLTGEYRLDTTTYEGSTGETASQLFLGGADLAISPRLGANFSTGGSFQTGNGVTAFSPYFESTLNYGYGRGSSISWTTHYGFEPNTETTTRTTFRTGLAVNHVLTAKLSVNAAGNFVRSDTESVGNTAPYIEDDYTFTLSTTFVVSPKLTLLASYTFTDVIASDEFAHYTRDQCSIGFNYTF